MKLETRLTVLLSSLLVALLAALLCLHAVQQQGTTTLHNEIGHDKARTLARALTLDGRTLERFVADYTQWDEMCDFVLRPDPVWAEINIQQSLVSWKFQASWIFDTEQREVHRAYLPPYTSQELTDFPSPQQRAALCTSTPGHFFHDTPRGMIEIRTSPIRPSDVARLAEAPRGWLFTARLWTPETLAQLGELTNSSVTLDTPTAVVVDPSTKTTVTVLKRLPDWQGQPLRQLTLRHDSPLLAQMIEYDANEVLFYLLCGCAFLAVTAWFLNHWVRVPLRCIGESLQQGQPALVAHLLRRKDEFAHIAALIGTAEEQRVALHHEVGDRTYAVQELRRAIAERAQLGRDLHDGVIQSIYAAGLTLQGVGPLVRSDPEEADRRLAICVEGLNRVIDQLRRHITGLEDDPTPAPSLIDGLQRLLQELRPARAVDYQLVIDPALDAAIPPDATTQLLLIAREGISNALRHGKASRLALRLITDNQESVFTIEDDGSGFTITPGSRRGHGLDNMTRRAEEIGAVLLVDTAPGRGTRIRVELPWPAAAADTPDAEP